MVKGYILAQIDVPDPAAYAASGYMDAAAASIAAHGGNYLVRGGNPAALEGEAPTARIVILEFPTRAAAEAFFHSQDYSAARALRQLHSTGRMVLLDGYQLG